MTYCKISLNEVPANAKNPGYLDSAFKALFGTMKVNPVLPFSRSEFKRDSVRHIKGMSISGVQQKLSLKVDESYQLVPTTEGGEYILKPSPEEFPNAAENEHTAMVTSDLLGIETALCGLVPFADGELVYITRRFDRLGDGAKLHQEDLLQGFSANSESKYEKSYEAAGSLILEMTSGKKAVVAEFIKRIMHAYLIGNSDMHMKNISLQKNSANVSRYYDRLTPNYDCLLTGAFENIDQDGFLALDLLEGDFSRQYQHYGFYTGYDFIELGKRLDVPEIVVKKIALDFSKRELAIVDTISKSYMPDDMKDRATGLIQGRMRAIQTGISR
jgi:serine/threonine-protein kinase HipA